MTGWVLDTSMALAWGFPDESAPAADRFWDEVERGARLVVPALWWYECANALVVARRRDRLSEGQCRRMSALLASLPVETAAVPSGVDLLRLQLVAVRSGLTAYDATYLDLAQTVAAGLATLDERLASAASDLGLTIWQP